jgi:hypothetical protein
MNSSPPLALGEQSIDFVVAWSIFSHYSEAAYRAWLIELNRILRPGGYAFITFQSDHLLEQIRADANIRARYMAQNVDLAIWRIATTSIAGLPIMLATPGSGENFGFDVDKFRHGVHFAGTHRAQLGEACLTSCASTRAWSATVRMSCSCASEQQPVRQMAIVVIVAIA